MRPHSVKVTTSEINTVGVRPMMMRLNIAGKDISVPS